MKTRLGLSIAAVILLTMALGGCGGSEESGLAAVGGSPLRMEPAHTSGAPLEVTLWAGQHIDAGTLSVWNDGTSLSVKYSTTGGWVMSQTHLYVGKTDPSELSAAPGQFPYSAPHDPTVSEYTYTVALAEIDSYGFGKGKKWAADNTPGVVPGDSVYIAAHADLLNLTNGTVTTVISDNTTLVTAGNVGGPYPYAALYAWEAFGDPVDGVPPGSFWDQGVDYDFSASGADWIWESHRTVNTVVGDIIVLEKTFQSGAAPVSATLHITCDNGYEAYINGQFVGSAQVDGDWQNSDLTETIGPVEYVNTNGWQSVEHYDITGLLQSGENTLTVIAVNEYMNPPDHLNLDPGTIDINPAGCIFEIGIGGGGQEETGWADGDDFGKSWAMYFDYTVQ